MSCVPITTFKVDPTADSPMDSVHVLQEMKTKTKRIQPCEGSIENAFQLSQNSPVFIYVLNEDGIKSLGFFFKEFIHFQYMTKNQAKTPDQS